MIPFAEKSPAKTLNELLDYLRTEHQDGDVYRGQVRDYPTLLPSMYRAGRLSNAPNQKVVAVDEDRIYTALAADQASARQSLHEKLVRTLGIALGNIIAQQYGLTSECVDVTEDLRVAAFFATRSWPHYKHNNSPDVGVIYRFRGPPNRSGGSPITLDLLDDWYEMAMWEDKYIETLVHRSDYERSVPDRHKWLGLVPAKRTVVSTVSMRLRWSQLREMIPHARAGKSDSLWKSVPLYDQTRTRTSRQSGGFIRPSFYWEADVPSVFETLSPRGRHSVFGQAPFHAIAEFDPTASRVMPSAAIKRRLVGVENLRYRDGLEAYFFKHGEQKVTGLYRHELWPEPSEDPLFALLWVYASMSMQDDDGSADDPSRGLLDCGYRVDISGGPKGSSAVDEMSLAILEDAREAIENGSKSPKDWAYLADGLLRSDQEREGLRAAITAVRLDPLNIQAGLVLSDALWTCRRERWTKEVLHRIEPLVPQSAELHYRLGALSCELGNFPDAIQRLRFALQQVDPPLDVLSKLDALSRLQDAATAVGKSHIGEAAQKALERVRRHCGILVESIEIPE